MMMPHKRSWPRPRRWLAGFAALVPVGILLSALFMAAPASADAYGIPVVSGIPGNCLDDWEAEDNAYGDLVDNFQCNGSEAQQFNVIGDTIQLNGVGLCLDVLEGGTSNGTPVQLYECNGTGSQVWIQEEIGNSSSNPYLVNPQSGKCLDDPDGIATPPGGPPIQLQIWDCYGNDLNQQWAFG
jgi:Ricin-type beta-trefoil lectin domain